MKTASIIRILVVALILAVLSCSMDDPREQQQERLGMSGQPLATLSTGITVTVIGFVGVFGDKTVLMTSDSDLDVSGNELDAYIGKRVRTTGILTGKNERLIISNTKVEAAE
jgi:hypothetical protein